MGVPTLDRGIYPGQWVSTLDAVPTLDRGIPTSDWEYLPWMGGTYPGWGIPSLDGGTYLGQGTTPPPPVRLDGVPPSQETEQHSQYLLCSGQYASYIHAGGLSCLRLH